MTRPRKEQVDEWCDELACLRQDAPLYQHAINGVITEVRALREEVADKNRRLEAVEWITRRTLASVPDAKQMQAEHAQFKADNAKLREELDALEFENAEMRRHGRNGPMVVLEGKYNAALQMIHKLRRQQKLEGLS